MAGQRIDMGVVHRGYFNKERCCAGATSPLAVNSSSIMGNIASYQQSPGALTEERLLETVLVSGRFGNNANIVSYHEVIEGAASEHEVCLRSAFFPCPAAPSFCAMQMPLPHRRALPIFSLAWCKCGYRRKIQFADVAALRITFRLEYDFASVVECRLKPGVLSLLMPLNLRLSGNMTVPNGTFDGTTNRMGALVL